MTDPSLSVVIPTHNRCKTLAATLQALERQTGVPGTFEVIVADDGCTDGTATMLAATKGESFELRTLTLEHRGPAAARNRAIEQARAATVLLLGDDTLPTPGTLATHLAAARGRQAAIQGRIDWDPTLEVTEVMRFLAPEGPQFYFKDLVDGEPVPYTAVLGSNLSAPTAWFLSEPFDERFSEACFEDTELAYRWYNRGRSALYCADAVCWHRHRYNSLAPFLARQRRAGYWVRIAIRKHPALAYRTLVLPTLVGCLHWLRHFWHKRRCTATVQMLWDLEVRSAFLSGLLLRKVS